MNWCLPLQHLRPQWYQLILRVYLLVLCGLRVTLSGMSRDSQKEIIFFFRLFLNCVSFSDRPRLSMSSLTQSHQVFFGCPLCLIPPTSHVPHTCSAAFCHTSFIAFHLISTLSVSNISSTTREKFLSSLHILSALVCAAGNRPANPGSPGKWPLKLSISIMWGGGVWDSVEKWGLIC